MVSFSVIVAVDKKFGIGKQGMLPWHVSGDLKHFKKITTQGPPEKKNVVIMGRRTWESLPPSFQPLPDRVNVVLTSQKNMKFPAGVICARGFDEALNVSERFVKTGAQIFVIGGVEVFRSALADPGCRKIYMTHINAVYDCDAYFPSAVLAEFIKTSQSPVQQDQGIEYFFAEYERRKDDI